MDNTFVANAVLVLPAKQKRDIGIGLPIASAAALAA